MRTLPVQLAAVILVCCLWLTAGAVAASAAQVNPKNIPEIDAGTMLQRISQEKGKVIVINVFASWCPPCREEIPGLVNVRRSFPENEVLMLGISVDKEPKALANYMEDLHINYPVLLAKGDFIQRVGVTAVPQLLIYDKQGDLVFNHKGLVDEEDLRKAIQGIVAE